MLLWILHRPVSSHRHRQSVRDQSVLSQSEFISIGCRALRTASSSFPRNRAGPLEFFVTRSAFLITDDDGPPWLEYRGPPGPNVRSHQDLVTGCKAASQAGSPRWRTFQQNSERIQVEGFATHYKSAPRRTASAFSVAVMQCSSSSRNGKSAAKERSSTVLRFASFPRSIVKRSGGVSRVKMNALRAPLTPLPTSPVDAAGLRLQRFPKVLRVMPPQGNRSASFLLRNFWFGREGRPFVVPFERFSFRSERSALR